MPIRFPRGRPVQPARNGHGREATVSIIVKDYHKTYGDTASVDVSRKIWRRPGPACWGPCWTRRQWD
jgi:hypothetical protein